MTWPNPGLIADLARLAAKYPQEDWDAVARLLRDSDRLADFAALAERLGSARRIQPRRVQLAGRAHGVKEALALLRSDDPDRADRLEEVWARLRRRELLPEMRSVRAFAEAAGLKTLKSTRREQAVAEIMSQVLDLSLDDLAAALLHASTPDRALGEEYGRWVRLILDRDADLAADHPEQGALETARNIPGDLKRSGLRQRGARVEPPSNSGRSCIFCGGQAGSAEHIFPNWINQIFPVSVVGQPEAVLGTLALDRAATGRRWKTARVATQTTKEVCRDCNTGWMGRLEAKAKPLLVPMMTGVPTTLTLDEQITVATWVTKTAMTAELVHGHEFNFNPEERRIVMMEQRPPAHVAVMASAIETNIGPCRATVARGQVVDGTNDVVAWIHVHTIQTGTLICQVMRTDPRMGGEVAFKTVQFAAPIEIPLFPPTPKFSWPPKKVLTEDRFSHHSQRIGSNIAIESFFDNEQPFDI